jgi:hypothetical protein
VRARILLAVAAAGLCLVGSAAYAQDPPSTDPLNPGPNPAATETPTDPGGTQEDQDKTDDPSEMAPSPTTDARPARMGDGRGPGRYGPRGRMRQPPPSRAAEFEIENGVFKFRVKCAENDSTEACAEVASRLLSQTLGGGPR